MSERTHDMPPSEEAHRKVGVLPKLEELREPERPQAALEELAQKGEIAEADRTANQIRAGREAELLTAQKHKAAAETELARTRKSAIEQRAAEKQSEKLKAAQAEAEKHSLRAALKPRHKPKPAKHAPIPSATASARASAELHVSSGKRRISPARAALLVRIHDADNADLNNMLAVDTKSGFQPFGTQTKEGLAAWEARKREAATVQEQLRQVKLEQLEAEAARKFSEFASKQPPKAFRLGK